jgi:hypothetical protein
MKNIGSIYRVPIDDNRVRYFWDVGTDHSQMGSALIVVFRREYSPSEIPVLDEVISDDVDFYCHTTILNGKKQGHWLRVGFRQVLRTFSMLFRDSNDYGNPAIHISQRWYVWEPNQPFRVVGALTGDLRNAEIGVVLPPSCVVDRMRTGKYGIFYPSFEPGRPPEA